MTLDPASIDRFLAIFDEVGPRIRRSPGCRHLELWQDERYPGVLTTYSIWDRDEDLQSYRGSPLFQQTWARTRPLFAAPPVTHSQHVLRPDTP